MTLPNLITIGRLVLVPFVIAMIGQGAWGLAFAGFAVAGLSDAVDGWIARRFDMKSELGAYLDALADKALLVSIFVTLSIAGVVPGWLAIVVVSRDVMIVAAILVSWLLDRRVAIRPLLIGKLNTAAQLAFAGGVLGLRAFGIAPHPAETLAAALVAGLAALSAAVYGGLWMRHMAGEGAR
ncbi:CDP-alcohol phosphatidyltransferase family protein [Methylobacterium nodulans]|uniref:CDP-diacylglycerol--glycerol-3-phosphate 3-phosphatidyltransferase n=1 Tax=Methylobacterium nodulans (strain LMG 21967 / CNCM I-2342 / ORS 2060) TaxID=460265 RepID=B8IP70_METNO|nr:CDP-alcohol phosphatidyltransferase family protein [Methylobacterium nodulans]ACL60388.1 CDP-alcohol phosphatidyltransferase [Methylobacterium nodulans ORS 2060]